jgi:uncharacterized protein (TIGR03435 family)
MSVIRKGAFLSVSVCLCLFALPSVSQTEAAPPAVDSQAGVPVYDVMSIRQNKTGSRSESYGGANGRFSANNVSLKRLLARIYDVRDDLIFGIPSTIDSARFDIEAKIVDPDPEAMKNMTSEQSHRMLLPMLAERFRMKSHTETRTLPVYDLVVIKSGQKFTPSADQTGQGRGMDGRGDSKNYNYTFHATPLSALTDLLATQVQRTVIDKTDLTGSFDFALTWAKHDTSEQTDSSPSIFTALQEQLGLKLEPAKGPVKVLVIDHVEMPSGN